MTNVVVVPKIKEENVDVEENENIEQDAAIDLGIPRPATRNTPGLNPITATPLVSNDDRLKVRKGLRDRARNESEETSERDAKTPPSKTPPIPAGPPGAIGVPNGGQSPHSTTVNGDVNHNGRSNSSTAAPEPERPMTKLKRFLSTLLQHSLGLSSVIGDRVRGYIHGLLLDTVGAEQFYSAIQALTNYPMKPFIISFIRTHLQTLQRELECTARLVRQTPAHYLRLHDNVFLDPAGSWAESFPRETSNGEIQRETLPFSSHNKRRSTDRIFMHQGRSDYLSPPPPKRMNGLLTPPWTNGHFGLPGIPNYLLPGSRIPPGPLHSLPPAMQQPKAENESGTASAAEQLLARRKCFEDEWKRVLLMLGSISDMVDKARRAVGLLQMRFQDLTETDRPHQGSFYPTRAEPPPAVAPDASGTAGVDLARKTEDLMAKALQQFTDDRVAEVRRKAEEAVLEVKQQAMVQFQKAVMVAESRVAMADAARYEVLNINTDHGRLVRGGSATQSSPQNDLRTQSCWNCGRAATETCSGCGIAWYCGSFCQHKDWETHHKACTLGRRASSASNSASFAENLAADRRASPPSNVQPSSDSEAGTCTDSRSPKMSGKGEDVEMAERASLDERSGFSLSSSESSRSPTAGHSPVEMMRSSSVK